MKKHNNSIAILNQHKRIVVVSEGKIQKGGKIIKTDEADAHLESFKYDIHD